MALLSPEEEVVRLASLISLASDYAAGSKEQSSSWFQKHGIKKVATEVQIGDIIVCPLESPDETEVPDDDWASTSNWLLIQVRSVNGGAMVIRLLGTAIRYDDLTFSLGRDIMLALPEYLIFAKGFLRSRGDGEVMRKVFLMTPEVDKIYHVGCEKWMMN